jgi:hypothetical protein
LPYTVTSVVFPGMVSNGIFALVYPVVRRARHTRAWPRHVCMPVVDGVQLRVVGCVLHTQYIVMASQARPQPLKRETPVAWARLPVFHAAAMLTTALVQHAAPS